MPWFLALECSTAEGSLVLAEESQKKIANIYCKKWMHQSRGLQKAHSDRLPLVIEQVLKQAKKNLSDLEFLCVGSGPGRWTGVRTALNVIRSLSFALKIPVYSVNSLRICAEPFLSESNPVFTAFNGFKNQVYFGEFLSPQTIEGKLKLLTFMQWCELIKIKASTLKKQNLICLSDLEDFYPLPEQLKKVFSFKKACPYAQNLAEIVVRQKEKRQWQYWPQLKSFYLKTPLE